MTSIKSEKKKILEPIEVFTLLYIEDLAKDVYKNQNHRIVLPLLPMLAMMSLPFNPLVLWLFY